MAKPSSDGKYVIVEYGDTLSQIAEKYAGGASKYKQLAAINNISNPDRIYVGQKIMLTNTGGSTTNTTATVKQAVVKQFGLQSDTTSTLFATWTWSKESQTESYKVVWEYLTKDGVWFVGSNSTISVDSDNYAASRQSTYSIPDNSEQVRFKVLPVSKTIQTSSTSSSSNSGIIYIDGSSNSSGSSSSSKTHFTASWSPYKTYDVGNTPPSVPPIPAVVIEKYKLTATLDNLDVNATKIEFKIVKNDTAVFKTGTANIITPVANAAGSASYSCSVDSGAEYKVCCRSYRDGKYSDWSGYSDNIGTIPAAPQDITSCKANSETSVYLEWTASDTAVSYDIEYTTKKEYFDGSNQTTTISAVEYTHYEITGLESGEEYFFRVRANNEKGKSAWSGIKSVTIGKAPAAPTTWSTATTVVTGETLNLYWVHNSLDSSSQTYAELELYIDGVKETHTIKNSTEEDEKDRTSSYSVNTSTFIEGTKILWRVRTAGITKVYGDWSVQRTVDIYAPPTLELSVTDAQGDPIEVLTSFPFYISALAGPNTQVPIGYHVTITANDTYEAVDYMGNTKIINAGSEVYSKYFDITDKLLLEMSAGHVDLENNVPYTVRVTVSMNSGLNAESSSNFTVSWNDIQYAPNAEITIDTRTLVAHVRPYCEDRKTVIYKVDHSTSSYTVTTETINGVYGEPISGVLTDTGEQVYSGTTADGEEVYYCIVEEASLVEDVSLSIYRREFDGTYTEIATGLDNLSGTFVTDPHPALDYARYRIVAITDSTGAVSYYDLPGQLVGCKSVIIQWDEVWSSFEAITDDPLSTPPWAGSLLKLPYNIDVSDNYDPDVSLIEYVGRGHPVSYYGTQHGESSTWNVEIAKDDEETLYGLRRLAKWKGDVYVREPSGTGYWAHVAVSFSQRHCELTVPVTLNLTRVEGGV